MEFACSNNALVDAGDNSASDYTGLGSSTGNNILTGYTGTSGHFAVENLNTVAVGNQDVLAENNNWGVVSTVSVIEGVIYDDTDNPLNTEVDFDPPSTPLAAAPAVVYVDDSWAGTVFGVDPDGVGGPATAYGIDAFSVIQDGINAVAGRRHGECVGRRLRREPRRSQNARSASAPGRAW